MSTNMINLLNAGGSGDASYRDPAVSPAGPTTTEPLPPEIAERNAALVEEFADSLYDAPADAILCLLYTSPSPRDRQKSRMPSSA